MPDVLITGTNVLDKKAQDLRKSLADHKTMEQFGFA
jgi:hypothetical protein